VRFSVLRSLIFSVFQVQVSHAPRGLIRGRGRKKSLTSLYPRSYESRPVVIKALHASGSPDTVWTMVGLALPRASSPKHPGRWITWLSPELWVHLDSSGPIAKALPTRWVHRTRPMFTGHMRLLLVGYEDTRHLPLRRALPRGCVHRRRMPRMFWPILSYAWVHLLSWVHRLFTGLNWFSTRVVHGLIHRRAWMLFPQRAWVDNHDNDTAKPPVRASCFPAFCHHLLLAIGLSIRAWVHRLGRSQDRHNGSSCFHRSFHPITHANAFLHARVVHRPKLAD